MGEINKDYEMPSSTRIYNLFRDIEELKKEAGVKLVEICYDSRNKRYIFKKDREGGVK